MAISLKSKLAHGRIQMSEWQYLQNVVKTFPSYAHSNEVCIVSWNESQFPQYFYNCVCHINRIPKEEKNRVGKDRGRLRLEVNYSNNRMNNNCTITVWEEIVNHHVVARANKRIQMRKIQTKLLYLWIMARRCNLWWDYISNTHRVQ